jgi:hypothetical protein
MNILFVHQNFPGQYKYLAPELARKTDTSQNRVVALRMGEDASFAGMEILGSKHVAAHLQEKGYLYDRL